ncbi:hypothetical protein SeLEV6574_g01420 [Synchytrium endobioticum]|uniref:Uncharacterized protein n=1 Tax=Synchytrium endobioticum TaxID=286115 RepID=A0A507DCW2_9FUNG|nr:hypothetical protein SeLEV6574_g01420 [Synchytrium endobioticum]
MAHNPHRVVKLPGMRVGAYEHLYLAITEAFANLDIMIEMLNLAGNTDSGGMAKFKAHSWFEHGGSPHCHRIVHAHRLQDSSCVEKYDKLASRSIAQLVARMKEVGGLDSEYTPEALISKTIESFPDDCWQYGTVLRDKKYTTFEAFVNRLFDDEGFNESRSRDLFGRTLVNSIKSNPPNSNGNDNSTRSLTPARDTAPNIVESFYGEKSPHAPRGRGRGRFPSGGRRNSPFPNRNSNGNTGPAGNTEVTCRRCFGKNHTADVCFTGANRIKHLKEKKESLRSAGHSNHGYHKTAPKLHDPKPSAYFTELDPNLFREGDDDVHTGFEVNSYMIADEVTGDLSKILVDNGTSTSIFKDNGIFRTLQLFSDPASITTVGGEEAICEGFGPVRIEIAGELVIDIPRAVFAPNSRRNILAESDIRQNGYEIKTNRNGMVIFEDYIMVWTDC